MPKLGKQYFLFVMDLVSYVLGFFIVLTVVVLFVTFSIYLLLESVMNFLKTPLFAFVASILDLLK